MGIQSFIDSCKNWAMGRMRQDALPAEPNKSKMSPNLGEDIHEVLHAQGFEKAMNTASPFLLASLGAWPGYWVYRGLDYHSHRAHVPLPIYIRQTFFQAKLLQLAIILAGTYAVIKEQRNAPLMSAQEP